MDQNFMRTRRIFPLVCSMALPMTISMLVNAMYNIVDSYFVAQISEDAMTALSLVYPLQNLVTAVSVGFGIGLNAVIAIYSGAGDRETAGRAASQGVALSVLHGLLLTLACIAVLPWFLSLFSSDSQVLEGGVRYGTIAFLFCTAQTVGLVYEKIFQAEGRMTVSIVCLGAGCLTNIILDPIMIFGLGPVPAMGIDGAAWATGIGQTVSLVLYLPLCSRLNLKLSRRQVRWEPALWGRIYSVGIPAALSVGLPSLMIGALNGILAGFSQSAVLVLGAYYKLQTFLYLTANGIVQGIRPLVGYNFGAGEHRRVKQIFRTALAMIGGVLALGTLVTWLIPGPLMELYAQSPETVALGVQALRLISLGFLISAVSVAVAGTLEGMGQGVPSLTISLLRSCLLILPLALVLSRLLGVTGVWHAFWVTEWVAGIYAALLFRQVCRQKL